MNTQSGPVADAGRRWRPGIPSPCTKTTPARSLAAGHVPAGTSDSAKTEVAGHKQDDHDESDEPNDSVHVRLPRSETGLDGNRRFTTPRRRSNGSRGWARHRPCEDCNTRDDLLSMPVVDAMPSSSRCQLLAAMGGLALARTASAQDTAPRRNPGAARGRLIAIGGALRRRNQSLPTLSRRSSSGFGRYVAATCSYPAVAFRAAGRQSAAGIRSRTQRMRPRRLGWPQPACRQYWRCGPDDREGVCRCAAGSRHARDAKLYERAQGTIRRCAPRV